MRANRWNFPVISTLFKAFGQLSDPRVQRIIWLSIGLAFAVLLALAVGIWLAVSSLDLASAGWLGQLIDLATGIGLVVVVWLLFPAAISATIGIFLEDIASAVEARHYPGQPRPRQQSLRAAVWSGVAIALVALGLNILVLPLYVAALFFPPLYLLVFYGLNGYLLGREYFEMVALRRLDSGAARTLRQNARWPIFWAGVIITLLLTLPVVNLVASVVGTAYMTHVFERLRRPAPPG